MLTHEQIFHLIFTVHNYWQRKIALIKINKFFWSRKQILVFVTNFEMPLFFNESASNMLLNDKRERRSFMWSNRVKCNHLNLIYLKITKIVINLEHGQNHCLTPRRVIKITVFIRYYSLLRGGTIILSVFYHF